MSETYWRLVEPIWNEINVYAGIAEFIESYSRAPKRAALLYAAHFCQSELHNGGFGQFFSNSTGILAPEAVEGFRAIGQSRAAEVVQAAVNCFGRPYPRDREERNKIIEHLDGRVFRELDKEFYSHIATESGGFVDAANRYANSTTETSKSTT